ncbi:hypothetical protein Dda_7224 [Drechslerella dactyloides]|uniref:Uncharacterized protein n=1 Tax=Drechslerella dactyloides TaxID=74499 RepID=A0AAD6NGI1_DREDA|nr:hypothetical protein Dda_7224 [Drechslerella dactyloides]
MFFTKTIIPLILAATVYSAPTTEADVTVKRTTEISKRGDALGDVWVCYDFDWAGKCANFIVPFNGCVNFQDYYPFRPEDLPAGSGRRTPRSIGPSKNTWCLVYNDFWCSGQFGGAFTQPGLQRIDGVKSIHCWW